MPKLKSSIFAELPEPETVDFASLLRAYRQGDTDLICVVGPTASGKTGYAVRMAREIGGEILSADSRQVYRGMDIGTGKDLNEYGKIPHHLIDIAPAGSRYNVYEYQKAFADAYADVRSRGSVPILCGGTGLYIEAAACAYDFNKSNPGVLPDKLPGKPYFIGTLVTREERNARIDSRLAARLKEGLCEEVQHLLDSGIPAENLIYYGLEYKFVTEYLIGMASREQMEEKLAIAIHQFAKRQMTWFRGMERDGITIHWTKV